MSQRSDEIIQLNKVLDILNVVGSYFHHKDFMNAALHTSTSVKNSPLHDAVNDAKTTVIDLIARIENDPEQTLIKEEGWPQ